MKKKNLFLMIGIFALSLVGCGETPHVHTYSEDWTSAGEEGHYHVATCEHSEEHTEIEPHDFNDWVVDVEATEYAKGSKHRLCKLCSYREDADIDKLPHTHKMGNEVRENVQEPTCTADGSYDSVYYCTECEAEISRETKTVPATGHLHQATRFEDVHPAVCDQGGYEYRVTYCEDCGTEISRTWVYIIPDGHDWGDPTYTWADDYSTCTAKRVCKNDSTHVEEETSTAAYKVVTDHTSEQKGSATYTCTFNNKVFATQIHTGAVKEVYNGEYPVYDAESNTVTYGLYPHMWINSPEMQTKLNNLTPESNGWVMLNNYYFMKIKAKNVSGAKFDMGISINYNSDYWFMCKPIVWNVLKDENGTLFLNSKYILERQIFSDKYDAITVEGETIYPNNYEHSEMRKWLTGEFYEKAFGTNNSAIQLTEVDNTASSTDNPSNQFTCPNTSDKVFLLSYQELNNTAYFPDYSYRLALTTDYSRARGVSIDTTDKRFVNNGYYWTRSPGSQSKILEEDSRYYVCNVNELGSLETNSFRATYDVFGVRPCIKIAISE